MGDKLKNFEGVKTSQGVDINGKVRMFNNDVTPFDIVVSFLCLSCGYTIAKATGIANEAQEKGSAVAFEGALIDCLVLTEGLRRISVQAEVC